MSLNCPFLGQNKGHNKTMANGEQKFEELLTVLENDRETDRQNVIQNRGGFKAAYKEAEVVLPEEGGRLSYFKDKDYLFPMKGAPFYKIVNKVGAIKRIILLLLNQGYKYLRKARTDPHLYCPSVKEIYRVANILIDRERNETMKDRWIKLRDIVCEILENDLAYRYRLQDIITELDINKVKLDEGDWFYCKLPNRNKHYNFGGLIPQDEWEEIIKTYEKGEYPARFSQDIVNKTNKKV